MCLYAPEKILSHIQQNINKLYTHTQTNASSSLGQHQINKNDDGHFILEALFWTLGMKVKRLYANITALEMPHIEVRGSVSFKAKANEVLLSIGGIK